jgi:hypothetical protein
MQKMLQTKYYKDMNHNYLIIECAEAAGSEPYQLKMITDNAISGLLRTSKRNINGEAFLYYEVNSLQALATMFEHRKMSKSMTVRLLDSLRRVLLEMKNYLLGDGGLLLKPEYIYVNWEREEVFFIYYPFEEDVEQNQVKHLLEYLVRVIDHRDGQLTEMIYSMCHLAEREGLSLGELEHRLTEFAFASMEQTVEQTVEQYIDVSDRKEEAFDSLAPAKQTENPYAIGEEKQKKRLLLVAGISAVGTIATLLYQHFFALSAKAMLLSWVLVVAFLVFFVRTVAFFVVLKYEFGKAEDEEPIFLNHDDSKHERHYEFNVAAAEFHGDTVFMAEHEEACENRLYGTNKGNKHIIELSHFPFTIGKLAENADFCLKEASISRLHVRFTKNGSHILMTDLNSTNGTYRNGIRLEPSETVAIEAGDEIRLGKLGFCFR